MNYAKTYIRIKKPNAANPSKPLSTSRMQMINASMSTIEQIEDKSARTFLHLENGVVKTHFKSQRSVNLVSSYPCLKRNTDGQGRKFSSTTIVNGSASFPGQVHSTQVHQSCIDERVLVLPVETLETLETVETILPDSSDIHGNQVGIFMDPTDVKEEEEEEETFTLTEDVPENCYVTVQEESTVAHNPAPKKITKPSGQKLLLPAAGKRGLIRFGRSRMIADTHTSIPVAEFKAQLVDTVDIIGKMDLAPSTKRKMYLLNTKGVNKLFAIPGRNMGSKTSNLFIRHLTLKQTPVDSTYDDMPLLPVGFVPQIDNSKIKRITRKRRYPEAEEYQRNLYKSQLEYLNSIETDAADPDECKVSIFMDGEEISSENKDGIVLLGSMDAMEVAIQEEEVLGDILYQEDAKEEAEVMLEGNEVCEETFLDDKSTIIMVDDRDGRRENIEEVLAEAEKRGIRRSDIQKVIIYQQGELDEEANASLFANNGQLIIMSCDPSESEIVVSS